MPLPFQEPVTVMIPAYNEEKNLPQVLAELVPYLQSNCADAEVLVVDDGSSDQTLAIAQAWGAPVRVLAHGVNQGLTATLRTGFFGAQKKFVTWVPADGQIPAQEMGKLLLAWQNEDLILSTYRHRPDGFLRAFMSKGLRVLLWLLTGFRDRLEGTYLFRRALLEDLKLVATSSAGSIGFEIAVKMRALGKQIGTTEIECLPRLSGSSKVANARNIGAYLAEIMRIRKSLRALKKAK